MVLAPHVAIVGGGIGGMCLAGLLQKHGISFTLYEQVSALGEVGAGLGLWSNAVRVLHHLGLQSELERVGRPMKLSEIVNKSGKVLRAVDVGRVVKEEGIKAPSYILHRAELHQLLRTVVDPARMVVGARCLGFTPQGKRVTLQFDGHPAAEADVVVGADGLRSRVRAQLWGEVEPDYGGEPCFRGVAEVDYPHTDYLRELQGDGQRAGICPLGGQRVYWWLTVPGPAGMLIPPAERQAYLMGRFAGWPHGLEQLIGATPSETILQNDLFDRPPLSRWSQGPVTLLGDAAHPTTPNLGQGACMAIIDAAVLTKALLTSPEVATALDQYEQTRRDETAAVVKLSRRWGKVGQWRGPVGTWVREWMVGLLPDSAVRATLVKQINTMPALSVVE